MKILDKIVSRLGNDKVLHFLCGALVIAQFEAFPLWWMLAAFAVLLGVSWLKERYADTSFDWLDIAAAMAGGFCEFLLCVFRHVIF